MNARSLIQINQSWFETRRDACPATRLIASRAGEWFEAVGAHSAHATLTEGDISITMLFTFDEGLLGNARAEPPERTPHSPFATGAPAKRLP